MYNCFVTIRALDRQTDGRTDGQTVILSLSCCRHDDTRWNSTWRSDELYSHRL